MPPLRPPAVPRHALPRRMLLIPALPLVLLCGGCQSKLQVDLAVSAPSGANEVLLAVPTVNLKHDGGSIDAYATGYDHALDLLPYSSGDDTHNDRLQLISEDNISGDFIGVRPLFDATGAYVKLSGGTQVPIEIGSQPDYAAISLSLSKSSTSGSDSADLVMTLELPFSLIDLRDSDGHYQLVPVVRVANKDNAGSISGTIAQNLVSGSSCGSAAGSGVAVYVYGGSGVTPVDYYNDGSKTNAYQPVASSLLTYDSTNEDYSFEIRYLPAGSYTVAWTCKAASDAPNRSDALDFQDNPTSVTVGAGSAATVSFD